MAKVELRRRLKSSRRCESVEHDANACDVEDSLRRLHCVFVVFGESTVVAELSEAPLHDPSEVD
jgi:hypothetical protein